MNSEEKKKDFSRLFKFKAVDEYLFRIFLDSELYFSGRDKLNDPNEALIRFTRQERVPDDLGAPTETIELSKPYHVQVSGNYFFCMTRNHRSVPMWSYYGDSHRGVCLEFDFSNAGPQQRNRPEKPWKIQTDHLSPFIDDVRYVAHLGEYSLSQDGQPNLTPDQADELGFQKLICWQKEKEVRMRVTHNETLGETVMPDGIPWKFERKQLKAMYFGLKTDQSSKRRIAQLARAMGFTCDFFEPYELITQNDEPCLTFRPCFP